MTGDDVVIGLDVFTPAQSNYDLGAGIQLHSVELERADGYSVMILVWDELASPMPLSDVLVKGVMITE